MLKLVLRRLVWGLLLALLAYKVFSVYIPLWSEATELEGTDVSEMTIEDNNGNTVAISSFEGKPLIINFWASWCLPCRVEFPLLSSAYPELEERNKQLIGVNLREPWSDISGFIGKYRVPFPVYRDQGVLAEKLNIRVIPSVVLIDENGKVVGVTYGFRPWIKYYLLWS